MKHNYFYSTRTQALPSALPLYVSKSSDGLIQNRHGEVITSTDYFVLRTCFGKRDFQRDTYFIYLRVSRSRTPQSFYLSYLFRFGLSLQHSKFQSFVSSLLSLFSFSVCSCYFTFVEIVCLFTNTLCPNSYLLY